jgi:hypothetical protein
MPYTIVLHIQNEDPVMCEVDELPTVNQLMVIAANPRRLDGKDLHYLSENVVTVMYPLARITFIEILPTKEEEQIIGFVRE